MSSPYFSKLEDEKIESVQTQFEFLNLLRLRHLQWMNSAGDPKTEGLHREIAELIEQMTHHYSQLLDALQRQRDAE